MSSTSRWLIGDGRSRAEADVGDGVRSLFPLVPLTLFPHASHPPPSCLSQPDADGGDEMGEGEEVVGEHRYLPNPKPLTLNANS